jgi:hypothetical protein
MSYLCKEKKKLCQISFSILLNPHDDFSDDINGNNCRLSILKLFNYSVHNELQGLSGFLNESCFKTELLYLLKKNK